MSKFIDLTNKRFGFWLVKKLDCKNKNGKTQWLCACECGLERLVTSNSLRSGNSTSCGCNHTPDLVDKEFGDAKVICLSESQDKTRRYWFCKCVCGETFIANTNQLNNKSILTCSHKLKKTFKINGIEVTKKNLMELVITAMLEHEIYNDGT